ncbi:MAG: hypothetical protein HY898_31240 [Deltaproteobacteria bacterium]|nr:hypothetical protein [Deltaproteobacteria bacterium]
MLAVDDVISSPQERDAIASSLRDFSEVAATLAAPWALIGGHALIAHGVPRYSPDLDLLVADDRIRPVVAVLVSGFGWARLQPHQQANRPLILRRRAESLQVNLHPARGKISCEAIARPVMREHCSVPVPVARLGAVLLMLLAADRVIDRAAIEQTVGHLRRPALRDALDWATKRSPELGAKLRAIMDNARAPRFSLRPPRLGRRK